MRGNPFIPFFVIAKVRVSGGHLCKAEAPTEAAAETVAAVWLTEGLLHILD